jgi:peptide/nickel transport system ATP-binding protein
MSVPSSSPTARETPLLEVNGITRRYPQRSGMFGRLNHVTAVDGVSFSIARGETFGLVGESGCGKSTTGRLALGLDRPNAGSIVFDSKPAAEPDTAQWRDERARMQMIYQDPLSALDRRLSIGAQVREPLDIHAIGDAASRGSRVMELLASVGLTPEHARRFPHELSGGQRQRVVLARALATRPAFLVCDEPISALDVSIQAQVVNLLTDLQESLGLTMLFISHDLRVVRHVSRRIAVMYLGRIVELGDADDLFLQPLHPYTRALVSASPAPGKARSTRIVLAGDPPNPADRPQGCAFHPRCSSAIARCRIETPTLQSLSESREVACHVVSPAETQEVTA